MKKWYQILPKNTGLSIYIWIIFCILPFYFLFKNSSNFAFFIGVSVIVIFFTSYLFSIVSKSWFFYVWLSIGVAISIWMTLFYSYVYFALFLSLFIGNIQRTAGFITLYVVHLVTTVLSITVGFFIETDVFMGQLPFIIISLIGIVLLPFNIHNRLKQEHLESLLDDATSKLVITEERQRIARDLHDTLGQKLSMIGLKSDLSYKLIDVDVNAAKKELNDIQNVARTALKEVRELVSDMRRIKLTDEVARVQQMLKAAEIKATVQGNPALKNVSILIENVLSMCLKEAVTNVVKHSEATKCLITIKESKKDVSIIVRDNGIGFKQEQTFSNEHGLSGIRERIEFINGRLHIDATSGTTLKIRIPNIIIRADEENSS